MRRTLRFRLNEKPRQLEVDDGRLLLWVLRSELGLTGAKYGCGEGHCGACTVLVDGEPTHACVTPVGAIEGHDVLTVEGLARGGELAPLQRAFVEHGAFQCGYCTPGMLLGAHALLASDPHPDRAAILAGLEGHLCRCGAHQRIVAAIEAVAAGAPAGRGGAS
jgi:nicotinate dehydrogenase subunit A